MLTGSFSIPLCAPMVVGIRVSWLFDLTEFVSFSLYADRKGTSESQGSFSG